MSNITSISTSSSSESLWENLEDIQNIFENELKDLKDHSNEEREEDGEEEEEEEEEEEDEEEDSFEENEGLIWTCGHCGSHYFKDRAHFLDHLSEAHSSLSKEKNKSYGCLGCGKGFDNCANLENHFVQEEVCRRDYDKRLLSLYRRHSVPRFFSVSRLRCLECSEEFERIYDLLKYFPRCVHSKGSKNGGMNGIKPLFPTPENDPPEFLPSEDENFIAFSPGKNPIADVCEDEIDCRAPEFLSPEVEKKTDGARKAISSCIRIPPLADSEISEGEEADSLVDLSAITLSPMLQRRTLTDERFYGFEKTNVSEQEDLSGLVNHGYNGQFWVESKVSKEFSRQKRLNSGGMNVALNLDGNYDNEEDSSIFTKCINSEPEEERKKGDILSKGVIVTSASKPFSLTMNKLKICPECDDLQEFKSHEQLLFHRIFYHDKSYCHLCDSFFDSDAEKSQHLRDNHSTFFCPDCSDTFPSYEDCRLHRYKSHGVYTCIFCEFIIPESSLKLHFSKNHKLSVADNFCLEYFSQGNFQILHEVNSTCATCSICLKNIPLTKIYSHFRYRHNIVSKYLLEVLVRSRFSLDSKKTSLFLPKIRRVEKKVDPRLNPLTFRNEARKENFKKITLDFPGKTRLLKFPQSHYSCPVEYCSEKELQNKDYGLHLLVRHHLHYCLTCDCFLERNVDFRSHTDSDHKNSYRCSICSLTFSDAFKLTEHRHRLHDMQTCIFCNNLIFTIPETFHRHVKQIHAIKSTVFKGPFKDMMSNLLTEPLASVDRREDKIYCKLCKMFDTKGTEAFREHLSNIHNVQNFDFLFASFDGAEDFIPLKIGGVASKESLKKTEDLSSRMDNKFTKDEKDPLSTFPENGESTTNSSEKAEYIDEKDFVEQEFVQRGTTLKEEITVQTFKCKLCKNTFKSDIEFSEHMTESHAEEPGLDKLYKCKICHESFYFLWNLNSHCNRVHGVSSKEESSSYKCNFCPVVTNSKFSMKRHLKRKHKSTVLLSEEYNFKCHFCDEKFWSLAERSAHIGGNHYEKAEEILKCGVCLHVSPNKNALRRHFLRMHPGVPLMANVSYECPLCHTLFQWKSQLQDHMKEAHKDHKEYQCGKCSLKLKSLKNLRNHQKWHERREVTPGESERDSAPEEDATTVLSSEKDAGIVPKPRRFGCHLCDLTFEGAKMRLEHYNVYHNGVLPFQCKDCDKSFSTKSSLANHKVKHANETFKCDYCAKEFGRRDSFNEHLLIHTGPRYRCPHCPKEFVQKSNLQRHIRVHLGIKPYKCNTCDAAFSDSAARNAHTLTHQNIKMACEVCGQKFARKQKLRYHMRIHTGDGLLVCDICQKIFTNSYSMKKHLQTHSALKPVYACYKCSEVFTTNKKLSQHLKKTESLGKNCTICGLAFNYETELNAHLHGGHKSNCLQKGYKCRHCGESYNSLSDIREHLSSLHEICKDFTFHYIDGFRNEMDYEGLGNPLHSQDENDDIIVNCAFCGVENNGESAFYKHMKTTHSEFAHNDTKECPICSEEIAKGMMGLNLHIHGVHPEAVGSIVYNGADINDIGYENVHYENEEEEGKFLMGKVGIKEDPDAGEA